MQVTAERKKELFKQHGGADTNTGSAEGQVALFTERIQHITEHLKINKQDHSAELSLIKLVGKRRALLDYLAKTDIFRYRAIIKELNLRK